MRFPEQFIKRGKFKLHSGKESNIFYDVNALLTNREYFNNIIKSIPIENVTYVGIVTGGAIIASHFSPFAMVKDDELKGKINGEYFLIDDVCTTEKSLKDAIKIIGKEPKRIFVVVDRRKNKNLNSIYEIDD